MRLQELRLAPQGFALAALGNGPQLRWQFSDAHSHIAMQEWLEGLTQLGWA